MDNDFFLKVAAASKPSKVAGAIAHRFREGQTQIRLRALGKSAICKAVYSIALAQVFLDATGTFSFTNVVTQLSVLVDGTPMTAYEFILTVS